MSRCGSTCRDGSPSLDSEAYAREFASRVIGAVEILEDFPDAGRRVPEFPDPSLREILHGHYRIIYEVSAEAVHLLAIHHAARLLRDDPRPESLPRRTAVLHSL